MNDVQRIWTTARDRFGDSRDRRTPSPGIAALLHALAEHGPNHGTALAHLAGQAQSNTSVWLRTLQRYGFARSVDEVPGVGHQGGGRPAVFWELTTSGRHLVRALVDAETGVTV
jgi:DNA-binding MarR family transcriptional regulator